MAEAAVESAESVRDALARATQTLVDAGCETPRLDAELLLAAALQTTRAGLLTAGSELVCILAATRFQTLIRRRAAREPVAYLIGRKHFRRLSLAVDRRVLVPRPETELLVELGCSLPVGARVADVGTGCGAIALALKDERPDLELWAMDLDSAALEVARANARALGLEVRIVRGDLLVGGAYDAVLANLPYVAQGDELAPEITLYEPGQALFGGRDGLGVLRALVARLTAVPLVGLEVGAGQAQAVEGLLRDAGFSSVQRVCDLAGHERVLVGRR